MLANWAVEIIPNEPRLVTTVAAGVDADAPDASDDIFHPKTPIDVTDRVLLERLGSVNRAAERDLLSFRTGDLTLTFDDHDGYLKDLFALFTATMRWQLRIIRNHEAVFHGIILGQGSLTFDDKSRTMEMTAYGPTRILEDTSAETVRRAFEDEYLVQTATGGASTLTLQSGADDFQTGDVIHLTDNVNSEDVTVKQVTSSTVLALDGTLTNSYATGSVATITTPYHRYRSIQYLVTALFGAAQIPLTEYRVSDSQFNKLAPVGVNLEGLDLSSGDFRRGIAEKDGGVVVSIAGGNTYTQATPDAAWQTYDASDRSFVDWSRYFPQGSDQPSPLVRHEQVFESGGIPPYAPYVEWAGGVNYQAASGVGTESEYWQVATAFSPVDKLASSITSDGTTWTLDVTTNLPAGNGVIHTDDVWSVEYDKGREVVLVGWKDTDGNNYFYQYDPTLAAWTNAKQGDDSASHGYFGMVYCADLDVVFALRVDGSAYGPAYEICAFRGTTRLWKRPFPNCLVAQDVAADVTPIWPTRTLRYVNGSLYCALVADGDVKLLRTDDEFQSYILRTLVSSTTDTRMSACRAGSQYRINVYRGASPSGYHVAAPFFAGVVSYGDFEGLSVSEALSNLAAVANAIFWIDDHLQGHFVARDLYAQNTERDITSVVTERAETLIWDQSYQYVEVSGSDEVQRSGSVAFAASGLDLSSDLTPNDAFSQALADAYYAFFGKDRKQEDVRISNPDGDTYLPMDRVLLGGGRFLVYESNHDLVNDETELSLLEDV